MFASIEDICAYLLYCSSAKTPRLSFDPFISGLFIYDLAIPYRISYVIGRCIVTKHVFLDKLAIL